MQNKENHLVDSFNNSQIKVRFAPSPTGHLHVGGARTALYNYLFARKYNGSLVLRIEDTDLERSSEKYLKEQLEDLNWLGIKWNEGIDVNLNDQGEAGPYRQSKRLQIYRKHVDFLINEGKAYYCFLSDEEIESQRIEAKNKGIAYQVRSPYRDYSLKEAQELLNKGKKASVRFKIDDPKKNFHFNDLVRGEITLPSDMVGDFIILRSDFMPVYNFCCTIDDFLMKITHVFRAEEHLPNTLRQLMLYEAFNWNPPLFGHLSIILGEDRQKLSKRHGAHSVRDFRLKGYLPEAIRNFILLLGWSSPEHQEIMSEKEMVQQFSFERLNSASCIFDQKKLTWMNSTYLRSYDNKNLWSLIVPYINEEELPTNWEWKSKALDFAKKTMEILSDASSIFAYFYNRTFSSDLQKEEKEVLSWEKSFLLINEWEKFLNANNMANNAVNNTTNTTNNVNVESEFLTLDKFKKFQKEMMNNLQIKGKFLFMPIRVVSCGKAHGPELAEIIPLIKISILINRVLDIKRLI